jgi:hypothetical protein
MSSSGFAFADPKPSPDNFDSFNPKDVFADSGIQVQAVPEAIPMPRVKPPVMSLTAVLGAATIQQIQRSGRIVLHSIGDSGGIKEPAHQFAVADALSADIGQKTYAQGRAALLFHLGDVVYYFGQEVYYFDQFYDPYRDYAAPIFAIPGNHDGVMYPQEPVAFSLEPFWSNFCSANPSNPAVAQSCARTTMTQPGVYFALDAPFIKIIGLYSNTSETIGTLTGPNGDKQQQAFLASQLQAAVTQRKQGDQRALIFAVHHPPFTGSASHFPSPGLLADMNAACKQARIMPDLVLSGHAHLYERYNRSVSGRVIPYVVAGNGGFYNLAGLKTDLNGNPPVIGAAATDGKGNPLVLKAYNQTSFGFLRVTVSAASIVVESVGVNEQTKQTSTLDSFTVDLTAHTVTDGIPPTHALAGGSGSAAGKGKNIRAAKKQPRKRPDRSSGRTT